MKRIVLILLTAFCAYGGHTQVVTPTIEGKFGVDADAQSNIFITPASPCSDCDDWWYDQLLNGGSSLFIIDTAGAGAIVAGYLSNPAATANVPFYRKMRYPAFYQTGERTLIDAIFVRDYHGTDQTAFVDGSNKNGDSPNDWRGDTKSILAKNDILDVYCHIRRQGPNGNTSDPLWLFGAVAVEGTNGDRYFDFEMYQTDIFYTRGTTRFTGYGPDAGHTSWQFDGSGNVIQAGDIIFAANYSGGSLSDIEARIWVDQAALLTTPASFDWTGTFDGGTPGAQYGYAGIQPKFGDPFYYGTENSGPTWGGPFRVARANNSIVTQYAAGQFMEFAVNLTALGLNPTSLMGTTPCGIPFSKVMVKTRSSTSFTSELKDFIAPFDLFLPPTADLAADVPVFCGTTGISNIWVTDPYSTSRYSWTTPNGHIATSNTDSTSLTVDAPGTYIVVQTLDNGCPIFSTDTAIIAYDPSCTVLTSNKINFNGVLNNGLASLDWTVTANNTVKYYTIEKSFDGIHFTLAGKVDANTAASAGYRATDELFGITASNVYYRIKINGNAGEVQYSKTVKLSLSINGSSAVTVVPNPVRNLMQINIASDTDKDVQVLIYDVTGKLMRTASSHIQKGYSTIKLDGFESWARGVYTIKVMSGSEIFVNRMLLTK